MHKLQMYEDLRDMLEREVKDIEKKGELDVQSLDNLYKLMTAIKVVDKCIEREKGGQGGQQGQEEMMRGMSMNSNAGGGGSSNASYGNSNRMMPYPYMSYDGMSNAGGGSYEGRSNAGGQSYGQSYERGRSNEGGQSNDGRSYDGMSNEGGMSNARRGRDGDGDGRYNESRDNFRNSQDRGNSYEGSYGYSRDATKKKMIQKLETLMDDTMSEHERQAIMDCINRIK